MVVKFCDACISTKEDLESFLTRRQMDVVCWLFARGGYASLKELMARLGASASHHVKSLELKGVVGTYGKKFRRYELSRSDFITVRCCDDFGRSVHTSDSPCLFGDPEVGLGFLKDVYGVEPVEVYERVFLLNRRYVDFLRSMLEVDIITVDDWNREMAELEFGHVHYARFRRSDILRVIEDLKSRDREFYRRFLVSWGIDEYGIPVRIGHEVFCVPDKAFTDRSYLSFRTWGRHTKSAPYVYVYLLPDVLDLCKRFSVSSRYVRKVFFSRFVDRLESFCEYFVKKYGVERKRIGGEDELARIEYFKRVGKRVVRYVFTESGESGLLGIHFQHISRLFNNDFAFKFFGVLLTLKEAQSVLAEKIRSHPFYEHRVRIGELRRRAIREKDVDALDEILEIQEKYSGLSKSFEELYSDLYGVVDPYGFCLNDVFSRVYEAYDRYVLVYRYGFYGRGKKSLADLEVNKRFIEMLYEAVVENHFLFCPFKVRLEYFEKYGIEGVLGRLARAGVKRPGACWMWY